MGISGKLAAAVVLVALVVGFLVAKRHELFPGDTSRGAAVRATAPAASSAGRVRSSVRVRELRILGPDESVGVRLGESSEASPGIWMTNARKSAVVEMGVHGNGFPFLLVSDGAVRNFGVVA